MIVSAGLAIVYQHSQILLVHPSGCSWDGSYGLPKGRIEQGETVLDAAIRETQEEVGIFVRVDQIDLASEVVVRYVNGRGKTRKRVHVFTVHINDLSEIGVAHSIIPLSMLQLEEVNWSGFVPFNEAEELVVFRFKDYVRTMRRACNKIKYGRYISTSID